MEKITHLNHMIRGLYQNKGVCGQQSNCWQADHKPSVKIHHCVTGVIENVSCADCADTYAEQNKTPEQHNLDTAFKIIAAKDKEIATLEYENNHLKSALARVNEEYRKYQNSIIDHVAKLIGKI